MVIKKQGIKFSCQNFFFMLIFSHIYKLKRLERVHLVTGAKKAPKTSAERFLGVAPFQALVKRYRVSLLSSSSKKYLSTILFKMCDKTFPPTTIINVKNVAIYVTSSLLPEWICGNVNILHYIKLN